MKRQYAALALTLVATACQREEPMAGGKRLSHWKKEAQQVSWMSFWNSDKDERRHAAFRQLSAIGEPAVLTLVDLLRTNRVPVTGDALNALAILGSRYAVRTSGDAHQRLGWMRGALAHVADPGSRKDFLATGLADPNPEVRLAAVNLLLTAKAEESDTFVQLLLKALRDSDPRVTNAARKVIGLRLQNGGVTPRFLSALLREGDDATRADAVWQLGNLSIAC